MPYLVLLLSFFLISISSCGSSAKSSAGGLQLATTIAPVAEVLTQLAGAEAEVVTLLPKGANPENYEPTTHDVRALAASKAYFYLGDLGFERSWVTRIQELSPDLKLFRLDRGMPQHSHGAEELVHDPHYWTSISGMRALSLELMRGLVQIDPKGAKDYAQRYEQLKSELDSLEKQLGQELEQRSSSAFVIYHPSLSEFAEEWGFQQLVVEEDGKEPSPRHVAAVLEAARKAGVRVVFVQKEFDSKIVQSIAAELGAKVVAINPLDADWRGELIRIAQALAAH